MGERTFKRSLGFQIWIRNRNLYPKLWLIDIDAVIFVNGKIGCVLEVKEDETAEITKSQQRFLNKITTLMSIPSYFIRVIDPESFVEYDTWINSNEQRTLKEPKFQVYRIVGEGKNDLEFIKEFNEEEFEEFLLLH